MTRRVFTFNGRNGAGAISVNGVKEGDQLTIMNGNGSWPVSSIANFVVVDDEILQSDGADRTTNLYYALVS